MRDGRFIGDAYVHPELTGRGVGRLALDLLEGRARELGADWPGDARIVLQCADVREKELRAGA